MDLSAASNMRIQGEESAEMKKGTRMRAFDQKQMRGIEPPTSAWEADVLPLNYICVLKNPHTICMRVLDADKRT